jgi:hypothetical protein
MHFLLPLLADILLILAFSGYVYPRETTSYLVEWNIRPFDDPSPHEESDPQTYDGPLTHVYSPPRPYRKMKLHFDASDMYKM